MSKRKHRKNKVWRREHATNRRVADTRHTGFPDSFYDLDDEDDDFEEAPRFDVDSFEEERRFDLDTWRSDLSQRFVQRERLRQRDIKRGILRGLYPRHMSLQINSN